MEQIENRMAVDSEWDWKNARPIIECCQCGEPIYEGEEYLDVPISNDVVHKECIMNYFKPYMRMAE